MQEIKLLIFVLLTICSYFKFKSGQQNNKREFSITEKKEEKKEEEEHNKVESQMKQELLEEYKFVFDDSKPYQVIDSAIQQFINIDKQLVPKNIPKANPFEAKKSYIVGPQDYNDVFGDEYSKCIRGKTLDMQDKTVIYSNEYYNKPIFPYSCRHNFFSNNQHLRAIQHLLPPKQSCQLNQESNNSSNQMNQRGNTYNNNFSFNINIDPQPMQPEDLDKSSRMQSEQELAKSNQKKKIIFKKPKLSLRRPTQRIASKQSEPSRRKKKTLICLQDIIKKKEQQLQILKQLHKTNAK